ncbi:hypothetical protein WPS_14780 [Vulcanimicrobium alpinum]|uniref:DUF5069 domain-containing protein n=1 Tax=Vulcanimicrobium alpinum TaxID=3016050 RepID=A0AAN1XXS0_UNVUL|nr:DUF5069 domain-containing protein [Vulcanimicrobium alpinum]BDE06202.1 hypothetical protein WPS_14780 [Vulcanimicrobium alpinum]
MQRPLVPVLSSSVTGPLGVMHLPRLWLKILLHARGVLPEGYRHGVGGFDEFTTSTLGIDRDAFIAYIETALPDYLALEAWVRANAANLTPEAIAAVNARVSSADLPEPMLSERRARFGLDDPAYTKAVRLNDLDDWAGIHAALVGGA